MFAAQELALDVSFSAAQARLAGLCGSGALSQPCQQVYEDGLAQLTRAGPLGGTPWLSKQVRVLFLDPVYRQDAMTLGLRWEATGPGGGLFPVLDADITLTPASEHTTRLALAGSYRPPLGWLGAALDRAVLHQIATATIRALLHQVADVLAGLDATACRQPDADSDPAPHACPEPEASA